MAAGSVTADKIAAGSITADKIKAGSITSKELDVNSIKANIINTSYINGLELTFDKGTIGGWSINKNSISKGTVSLDSDGSISNGDYWTLKKDGSGFLAKGNISWTNTGSISVTGEINATSGSVGGFVINNNNLICEKARLVIGQSTDTMTRKVILDAQNVSWDQYNYAFSLEHHGIISRNAPPIAGMYIDVGSDSDNNQYPAITVEKGCFIGFRCPVYTLGVSLNLNDAPQYYCSGMVLMCNSYSDMTIILPTASNGAKQGDIFTAIKKGPRKVTFKCAAGGSYHAANGSSGEWACTSQYEHVHFIFDGTSWYSECSRDS